jgi:hypothetical protein
VKILNYLQLCVVGICLCTQSVSFAGIERSLYLQERVISTKDHLELQQSQLPAPYDFLLTQPLMTQGLESHYGRTPIIQPLYAKMNDNDNTYSRTIIMLVDRDAVRNNPELAKEKSETVVVEVGFITMNFNALPEALIHDVLNTDIPFGKLLETYHIKTESVGREYFSIHCGNELALLTHCELNKKIYGRKNTLIREDNKNWVARVVEVLTGNK